MSEKNIVSPSVFDGVREFQDPFRAQRDQEKQLMKELEAQSNAEFAKQRALQERLSDMALIWGKKIQFDILTYNDFLRNKPNKYEMVTYDGHRTPVVPRPEESDETSDVGYYINAWDGTRNVELRRIVTPKGEDPHQLDTSKLDVVMASKTGTVGCEFTSASRESILIRGPMFEAPTEPIPNTSPFKVRDDKPVPILSDSPEFWELRCLVQDMSLYYRAHQGQE